MEKTFEGRTVDVDAPFLGAEFWKEGVSVKGMVSKVERGLLDGKPTTSYTLELTELAHVDGEDTDQVRVGSLSGFTKALEAAGVTALICKDLIVLTCEGVKRAKKEGYSDRVNFHIKVTRPS
jgi:hypothetical protein